MKKILIVMSNMGIGGAEKSLLSFLKALSVHEDKEAYAVDLMVVDPSGPFYSQIPDTVGKIAPPKALRWLGNGFGRELLTKHFSLTCLAGQIKWNLKKSSFPKPWNRQQRLWECWKSRIPEMPDRYDAAISYVDGYTNYYVMEKVNADKKILWVHSEYQKRGYDPVFDRPYYEKADGIVTISQQCKACIVQAFPTLEDKVFVLENITLPEDVLEKSKAGELPGFRGDLKLVTVARLNPLKGVDMAVEAAKLLKDSGLSFDWLIVGDGPERSALQAQIDMLGVGDCFCLAGSRENPYVFMNACDILVQPSRVEGRSIVLDEAMILEKPIVATNYTTVVDSLTHGETGLIVDMTPDAIAGGILRLYQDDVLKNTLRRNLRARPKDNTPLVRKYIDIMF